MVLAELAQKSPLKQNYRRSRERPERRGAARVDIISNHHTNSLEEAKSLRAATLHSRRSALFLVDQLLYERQAQAGPDLCDASFFFISQLRRGRRANLSHKATKNPSTLVSEARRVIKVNDTTLRTDTCQKNEQGCLEAEYVMQR